MGTTTHALTATELLPAYVEAMLWANASCGVEACEDGREVGECEHTQDAHGSWDESDLSDSDRASALADLEGFLELADPADVSAYLSSGLSPDSLAHDFALTRNRHGAGFWDRGIGEPGDRLTRAAHTFGESHVYVSEDGITLD